MRLNYQLQENPISNLTPIVFIHGLFGSLSNLGMLARHYSEQRTVIQLDVRNHGLSDHSSEISYHLMAQDILETLDSLEIQNFIVVGHSMGGKIAMKLADLASDRVERVVVLDISPVQYKESHHTEIFKALFAVEQAQVSSRTEAAKVMRDFIDEEMVIQFLLKSFNQGKWLFNVHALYQHYTEIMAWDDIQAYEKPTLFLRGGLSFYISKPEHVDAIHAQFANAEIILIENAGHWLHGEKTAEVLDAMNQFLA